MNRRSAIGWLTWALLVAPIALASAGCFLAPWSPARPDPAEPVSGPAPYVEGCQTCHAPIGAHYAQSLDRTPRRDRAALALVSMAFGLATAASGAASLDLSADQQHRLAAGEVVVLGTLPPGASESARGGTAVALVRAAPERVWPVLVDYRGHPRYYPRVVSAEPVEADAHHALVRYEVGVGPFSFGFYMIKYPDPVRRRIDWHLDPSHANNFFRENIGYWQVDPAESGSLVTYAIAVRTILPGFVTRGAERQSLVDTITKLRKLVEDDKGAATR